MNYIFSGNRELIIFTKNVIKHSIRLNECDVKLSKKRPLWLVWKNNDKMAEFMQKDFKIIFKNGDGFITVDV